MTDELRLNLGAGIYKPIEGFTPVGRQNGSEVYPLEYADASVADIRASHILEHFSFRKTPAVLQEWVRVLKPGGTIKVAVPSFEWLVRRCVEGEAGDIPIEKFLMGGQTDDDDYHKAVFSKPKLSQMMRHAGLVDIHPWFSDIGDDASLPVSLNLEGRKPLPEDLGMMTQDHLNNYKMAVL